MNAVEVIRVPTPPARFSDVVTRAPTIAFAIAVVVLCAVWFRFHSWESYMYASASEGFFQPQEMFSAALGGAQLPEIAAYHPYHPLFHMTVGALLSLQQALGCTPDALLMAVLLNKAAALAVVVLAFRIVRRVVDDNAGVALVAVLWLASTKAFLFAAFSGEAHLLSLAFFLGAFELVSHSMTTSRTSLTTAALAGAVFSVGAAMNLAIFFYGLAPLAVLLVGRRVLAAAAALATSFVLLFAMYVIVPVSLLGLTSVDAYLDLFLLYAQLPQSDAPVPLRVFDYVDSMGQALFGGDDVIASVARVVIASLVGFGLLRTLWLCLQRSPRLSSSSVQRTPRFWIVMWAVGFGVGEIALNTAKSINGVVYCVVPLTAAVALSIAWLFRRRALRLAALAVVSLLFAADFERVVLSKVFVVDMAPRLSTVKLPDSNTPVAVVLDHMSLFQEIHHLGHDRHFTSTTTFITSQTESRDALQHWVQQQPGAFCILSTSPLPRGMPMLVSSTQRLHNSVYHYSVNHPDSHKPIVKRTFFGCRVHRS
jgi:hypothetical protein